jgi:branched-subunit amino acid transport protein
MMSETALWITIAGLTAVSVLTRNVFLLLGHRVVLPERLQHALRYAPACALVALIVPEVVLPSGVLTLAPTSPRLAAAVVAVTVLLTTRRAVAAIGLGMAAYTLARLL